ncbi:MAG: hypothetical protein U9N45_07245, partial [Gemmatimonadota bacterium]|nr:hypothetical protein [Gemmatimonadota bacterium]
MARFFIRVLFILFLAVETTAAGADWRPGVVDSMAGRFGAFMEGCRYRRLGYLSLISDGPDLYSITMGQNLHLGRPWLPGSYTYKEKYTWTGAERSWSFESEKGGEGFIKVYESLLAPGFLYEMSEKTFRWLFEEQKTGQGFILPLESGVVCRSEGERYISAHHGPMAEG